MVTGGPDLLSPHGSEWKFWRAMFNPGFSLTNIKAQIASIVDSAETCCELLQHHAGGDIVKLVPMTTKLTMKQ